MGIKLRNVFNDKLLQIISDVFQFMFIGLILVFVLSPVIGTIAALIGLEWNIILVLLIIIGSFVLSFKMIKCDFFSIDSYQLLLCMIGIVLFIIIIYIRYSPVLEIRQDPSLYMMKSMNLVNYGTIFKPSNTLDYLMKNNIITEDLNGYAAIQNGTKLLNGNLYTDFYPGFSFFAALFGLFNKGLIFYSQTLIMIVNGVLMMFIIKKITTNMSCGSILFLVCSFFIAPLIVFFGRGSYCEPSAMLYILLIINVLLTNNNEVVFLSMALLGCQYARIDYLLVVLIGVLVVTYKNRIAGAIYTAISVFNFYILSKVYWIYYDRITAVDMPILKYGIYFLIIAFLISFVIAKYGKSILENVFYSKYFKWAITAIGLFIVILMFKNNIMHADQFQMEDIHGKYIMTYSEFIWDLLFLSFPSFILVMGIVNFGGVIEKNKIPFLASGFIVTSLGVYLYFFLNAGNSPQLYWMIRRYYNLIVPSIFILFCILIDRFDKKTVLIVSVSTFLITSNLFLDSKQRVDYQGLDKSVKNISNDLDNSNIGNIYYDTHIRYEISSLLSYNSHEFIPVEYINLNNVLNYMKEKDQNAIYITNLNLGSFYKQYNISFRKMGETYGELPKEVYPKSYNLYCYNLEQLSTLLDNSNNLIYPTLKDIAVDGLYEDNWTNGNLIINDLDLEISKNHMYLEMSDFDNPLIKNDDLSNIELDIIINDTWHLTYENFIDNKFSFDVSNLNSTIIKKIEIKTNTFNLSKESDSSDNRDLGINVKSVYFE